jgi:hypothetical protein
MLLRRIEKATPATQIALVGHIIDGTADIESRYPPIPLTPSIIQQRTDSIHKLLSAILPFGPGWSDHLPAKEIAFFVIFHPHGQVGIDVVKPRPEGMGICDMTVEAGRDHGAARGIMTAVAAIRIGYTAGHFPVPGQICPVLPEGPSQTDIHRRVSSWVGAAVKVMEPVFMGMGYDIVGGEKDVPRIFLH